MICYVISYIEGENWKKGEPTYKQNLSAHVDYMASLYQNGSMILGGPYTGGTPGGMTILRANSLTEVENIVSKDPAVLNKVYAAKVTEWQIVRQNINDLS